MAGPRTIGTRRLRNKRSTGLVLWAVLLLAAPVLGRGSEPGEAIDFAFAAYLGSGLYRSSGQELTAVKLPFYWSVRERSPERWGLKINVPLTLGVLHPDNTLLDPFVLGRVAAASIVPGVEFSVALRPNWWLMPFVDIGGVWDDASRESSALAGAGLKSLVLFEGLGFDFRLLNRLLYAAQTEGVFSGRIDDIGSFDTGLEAGRRTSLRVFGYPFEWSIYAANFLYFEQPELTVLRQSPEQVRVQNEIGVTAAVSTGSRFSVLRTPRIGIGYRTGDGLSLVRLVLGAPF